MTVDRSRSGRVSSMLGIRGDRVFWGKAKRIEESVLRHFRQVQVALAAFHGALDAYVVAGDLGAAKRLALETHDAEGKADDIRREVEAQLLEGALLASSRRDILEVIEQVDRLANSAEAVLDTLLLERFEIPEPISGFVREISEQTAAIVEEVDQALHALFHDTKNVVAHTQAIEKGEGAVDRIEREALKAIFRMDVELARKLQLRDFIRQLVEISDRAEDLSDRLDILVAERVL